MTIRLPLQQLENTFLVNAIILKGISIQPIEQSFMEQPIIDKRLRGKARMPQQQGPKKVQFSIEAGASDRFVFPPVQHTLVVVFALNVQ
jgi:hypothetical protein